MARIGIIGSEGAMGAALISVVERSDHELSGGIDRGGDPAGLADRSDVLVDFSAPQALEANLHAAIGAGIPLVIGTTGLEARHHLAIDNAARAVPVLQTGNTSLGVTLLAHLVREAAQRLGPDWDIEILEMHHRRKVDAPSGTAILLGAAAAEGRGIAFAENTARGRDGQIVHFPPQRNLHRDGILAVTEVHPQNMPKTAAQGAVNSANAKNP